MSTPLDGGWSAVGEGGITPTREIPQTVQDNVFTPRRGESYWAATITLPQIAGDATPIVLYVARALVAFAVPPEGGGALDDAEVQAFDPTMSADPQIKFSSGGSPDGGELNLQNSTRVLGQTIAQVGRKIAGSRVRVFKVWRVFGVGVPDEVFVGFLKAPKVVGDTVTFPLVSDMSRKGEVVGGELLTMRCKLVFKDGVHCTYAGAETFCSHVLDDAVEGCKKYGHEFEFDGIPTTGAVASVVAGVNPNGGSTGFGDDGSLIPNPRGRNLDRDFHPGLVPLVGN